MRWAAGVVMVAAALALQQWLRWWDYPCVALALWRAARGTAGARRRRRA